MQQTCSREAKVNCHRNSSTPDQCQLRMCARHTWILGINQVRSTSERTVKDKRCFSCFQSFACFACHATVDRSETMALCEVGSRLEVNKFTNSRIPCLLLILQENRV